MKTNDNVPSLIGAVLGSDLPESEKSTERLLRESQVLISAGTDTTAMVLSFALFHLLSDPERFKKLRTELETAIPDPQSILLSRQVENLPYLTAIVKETIRLHSPGCMRQERVAPDEDLIYTHKDKQYLLPKGVRETQAAKIRSHADSNDRLS